MSTPDRFTCFRALPSELRLQIWKEALSVRSVWAVTHIHTESCGRNPNRRPFVATYVGPAPYLVGLSCREARQVLEQLYVRPVREPSSSWMNDRVFWVDLERTVVFLGDTFNALATLNNFGRDELSRFKHVALRWSDFRGLLIACKLLAKMCPALCAIIIHKGKMEAVTNRGPPRRLSLQTTACYTTILTYCGPELECEDMDSSYLRSLLLEHLGDSPPRLHLLPPDL